MHNSLICSLIILCLGCSSKKRSSEEATDNDQYRETETAVYSDLLTEIDWFAKSIKNKDSLRNFIFFLETDTLNSIESEESDSILLELSYLESRILDREHFNLKHQNKVILSKTYLTEQQRIAENKKYEEYKKDHLSIPHSYRFSRVLFNSGLNLGLLRYHCIYNCSGSCRITVERLDNKWKIKKELNCTPPF